jgi:ketosteroid isomerase-like protein
MPKLILIAGLTLFLSGCLETASNQRKTPIDLAQVKEEVRNAEISFATAFKSRDTKSFLTFIDKDARFLGGKETANGKAEIEARWKKFLEPKTPPFSWTPKSIEVSGDGAIGLSSGPVLDEKGNHVSDYYSIWRKQSDGTWKVIFDGPGCQICQAKP